MLLRLTALLTLSILTASGESLAPLLEPIREKHSLPSLGALTIVDGKVQDIGTTGLR